MSWAWGRRSQSHLEALCSELVVIFDRALDMSPFDIAVTDSHRGEQLQNEAFARGSSQLRWPESKHNKIPAQAGHLDPYPIDYGQTHRYYVLAGVVFAAAHEVGYEHRLRWGGDWDRDFDLEEETFRDLAHWEII